MANTALPNQPLIEHPLPYGVGRLLGAGATLVSGAAPNTDSLLVPAPAASANGVVARGGGKEATIINSSGTAIIDVPGNFALVYKAEDPLEAVFGETGVVLANDAALGIGVNQFLLDPTDRGIYLRLGDLQAAGPVDFPGTLNGYLNYNDYRDVTRVAVDLTDEFQTILVGERGKTRMLAVGGDDFAQLFAVVANFDSVDHGFEARVSDGVNTIPLIVEDTISAGTLEDATPQNSFVHLLEGWSLQARITETVTLRPCRLIVAYTDTNLSPVRTNQGGAY